MKICNYSILEILRSLFDGLETNVSYVLTAVAYSRYCNEGVLNRKLSPLRPYLSITKIGRDKLEIGFTTFSLDTLIDKDNQMPVLKYILDIHNLEPKVY